MVIPNFFNTSAVFDAKSKKTVSKCIQMNISLD